MNEVKQVIRDGYDRVSLRYRADHADRDVEERYSDWLSLLRGHLAPGNRVLDLGCGCGVPLLKWMSRDYRCTGVDLSRIQITRARSLAPAASLIRGDMARVNFRPASFHAVVALYSLIHLPLEEQADLIQRMADWTVPGGLLMATVGAQAWTGVEQDWLGVSGATMYWSHEGEPAYLRWFEQAGLRVIRREFVPEGEGGHVLLLAVKDAGAEGASISR